MHNRLQCRWLRLCQISSEAQPPDLRQFAHGCAINWTTQAVGPPLGGALIGVTGPTITLLADSVSYLASASLLRRASKAQPEETRAEKRGKLTKDLFVGWVSIFADSSLRSLYINALIFGGAFTWSVPVLAVLTLRELGISPLEYGIVPGVPSLGGLLGALISPRLAVKIGERPCLLAFGLGRTLWLLPLPFVGRGFYAILIIGACQFMLLLSAGIFNPIYTTYRMRVTSDTVLARVSAAWSVSAKSIQPLFITIGGLLATALSTRASLLIAGCLCAISAAFLPWKSEMKSETCLPPAAEHSTA